MDESKLISSINIWMSITIITKRSDYPKYDFALSNFAFANFIFYQIGSKSNDVMKVMWKSNEMWNSIMDDVNNFKFVNMHSDWYFCCKHVSRILFSMTQKVLFITFWIPIEIYLSKCSTDHWQSIYDEILWVPRYLQWRGFENSEESGHIANRSK